MWRKFNAYVSAINIFFFSPVTNACTATATDYRPGRFLKKIDPTRIIIICHFDRFCFVVEEIIDDYGSTKRSWSKRFKRCTTRYADIFLQFCLTIFSYFHISFPKHLLNGLFYRNCFVIFNIIHFVTTTIINLSHVQLSIIYFQSIANEINKSN